MPSKALETIEAANVASVIENGSCISFSIGPLFEALSRHLSKKRNLGIHSPFFTDALMDLMTSGAVTNRNKEIWQGKSLTSYALGTPELMEWLNRNPLVEFQSIDKVFDPVKIGSNPKFIAVFQTRRFTIDIFQVLKPCRTPECRNISISISVRSYQLLSLLESSVMNT